MSDISGKHVNVSYMECNIDASYLSYPKLQVDGHSLIIEISGSVARNGHCARVEGRCSRSLNRIGSDPDPSSWAGARTDFDS